MNRVDLLVVTVLAEELLAVLNLKEGGKNAWIEDVTSSNSPYYTTELPLDRSNRFTIAAVLLPAIDHNYLSHLLYMTKPKMVCRLGLSTEWKRDSIAIGDIISASNALLYSSNQLSQGLFHYQMQDYQTHPHIQEWLCCFDQENRNWADTASETEKPKSHFGMVISLDRPLGYTKVFDQLAEKEKDLIALDMEAAKFFSLCDLKDSWIAGFIVKAVADNPNSYYKSVTVAAQYMLHFARYALAKFDTNEKGIWKIPKETIFFTGREQLIEQIGESFKQANAIALVADEPSFGAVGKTETALKYANTFRKRYKHGFLIKASTELDLTRGFIEIASKLELKREDEKNLLSSVKQWIKASEGLLLIFDEVDLEQTTSLQSLLSQKLKSHILLVSKTNSLEQTRVEEIKLSLMTAEEARGLFIKRIGKPLADEEKSLESLSAQLHYLVLPMSQAASYIAEKNITFQQYLDIFLKTRTAIFGNASELTQDQIASVVVEINFQEISKNIAARDLLYFTCFLDSEKIPFELINTTAVQLFPTIAKALEGVEKKPGQLKDLLYSISYFALINIDISEKSFTVDKLLHQRLREKLLKEQKEEILTNLTKLLLDLFPKLDPLDSPLCNRLITHISKMADSSENEELFNRQSGMLFNIAGYYCYQRARYSEAEPLFLKSLTIFEKALGMEHSSTAASLNNLAELYKVVGKYDKAEPLYLRALDICEKVLGEEHPSTATSLSNLALLYSKQAQYSQAESLLIKALEIREKILGKEHPSTATTLNNLAGLYTDQDNFSAAESFYKRALEIREKVLGKEYPSTATTLNNLAELYFKQKEYSKAEPLLMRALAIREKVLGKDHPSTAKSLYNLAWLYETLGDYTQAEHLTKRALEAFEKTLGAEHQKTKSMKENYFVLLYKKTRAEKGALQ
ncbi:MAG: tetratricopeptide repeat protein [Blastocatellia bacterium]|nr:tetratricopeptide repeat protein [Blastocatellia bacterium]